MPDMLTWRSCLTCGAMISGMSPTKADNRLEYHYTALHKAVKVLPKKARAPYEAPTLFDLSQYESRGDY